MEMEWIEDIIARYYKAFIVKDRYLAYLEGFKMTLVISLFAVLVGLVIGLVIAIIKYISMRKKGLWLLKFIADLYIGIIRGTPVYVQMLIIYYIVFTSRDASPVVAAVICFGINSSAYVAEIIRAGIEAVDQGQTEAGRSLGLGSAVTMIYIVLPQAVKNILPALGNEFIVLIKETAIVGTIAVMDVTKAAQNIGNNTYDLLPPLIITAIMYFIVVMILTKLLAIFERRLAQSDRR